MSMTKQDVHARFVAKLSAELEALTAAAKNAIAMATDEAHRAESKYDTFSLENSYLARGQAQRVEELRFALDRLQALAVKELNRESVIQHGSLVRLEASTGKSRTLYFCPGGGGEQVEVDGAEVCIITAASPLGKAVLGKRLGATVEVKIGRETQTFRIAEVE
jgi:transcription elongation GreA/GreB family factor